MKFKINKKIISNKSKTYFIADIAANHDGSLKRAKELIHAAKASGADAAKFQHFSAETIVSDFGFKSLKGKLSHQANWKKSVFDNCNRFKEYQATWACRRCQKYARQETH